MKLLPRPTGTVIALAACAVITGASFSPCFSQEKTDEQVEQFDWNWRGDFAANNAAANNETANYAANWNQWMMAPQPNFAFTYGLPNAAQDDQENEKLKELHEKLQKLNQEQAKLYKEYYSQFQQQGDYGAAAQMWRQQANAFDALKYYQDYANAMKTDESADRKYWIGVQSAPLSSDVREFLGLDDQIGLRIVNVVEDSPAAKQGLQPNDVIIAVNDQQVSSIEDLVQLVHASQGESIELLLNRQGREQTVQVKPESRPEGENESAENVLKSIPHLNMLFHDHLSQLSHLKNEKGDIPSASIQLWGSPANWTLSQVEIPEDVHFELKAVGNGPAELTIKNEEEEFTVSLDELSELPGQLRVYSQAFLNRLAQHSNQRNQWSTGWSQTPPGAVNLGLQWMQQHQLPNGQWQADNTLWSAPIYYGYFNKVRGASENPLDHAKQEGESTDVSIETRLDRLEQLLHEMHKQMNHDK